MSLVHHGLSALAGSKSLSRLLVGLEEFKQQLTMLDEQIDPVTVAGLGDEHCRAVKAALDQSFAICREFESCCDHESTLLKEAQELFRRETEPWLSKSWFAHRARTKPSGFAGDFDMLVKIYERATPARGLGSYIDQCFMNLPLARAVRGRMHAARKFLLGEIATREDSLRILDIASGPCREYEFWPEMKYDVEVVALDNDPHALYYVEQCVAPCLTRGTTLRPVRYNALQTRSAEATISIFGRFDIIYSVGLCDYLSDTLLIRLLRGWRETLNDQGVMYVAFKDTTRYDKTPYQWHLDWFFYQRTLQDVMDLYDKAGFDTSTMETTRDESGVIINFINRQRTDRLLRVDQPAQTMAPNFGWIPTGDAHVAHED